MQPNCFTNPVLMCAVAVPDDAHARIQPGDDNWPSCFLGAAECDASFVVLPGLRM